MMNRSVLIVLFALCGLSVSAQTRIRDLWASMPTRMLPVLTENNRLDMIDFIDSNMEAKVRNVLDGFSTLDTLTDDYLRCTLTSHTELQMRLLPAGDSTVVVAVVHTSRTPEAVSTIRFYNSDWTEAAVPAFDGKEMLATLKEQENIDTSAVAEYMDLPLISMTLSPDSPELTLTASTAHLSRESRKVLDEYLKPITVYWNETTRAFIAGTPVRQHDLGQ